MEATGGGVGPALSPAAGAAPAATLTGPRQQVASAGEVDLASPAFDCCWMLPLHPAATS